MTVSRYIPAVLLIVADSLTLLRHAQERKACQVFASKFQSSRVNPV